jgi:hypothetical protein
MYCVVTKYYKYVSALFDRQIPRAFWSSFGLFLDAVRPRALNAVPLVLEPAGHPSSRLGGVLLSEKLAVGTLRNVILLDHESIEEAAVAGLGVVLVLLVVCVSVLGADGDIVRAGEEVLANARGGVIVDSRALLRLLAALRSLRLSLVGLGVPVGADDGDLEVTTVLASVVGSLGLDTGTPERALVVCDGVRLIARALLRVPLGIALDVDVESSAEVLVITPVSATLDIVGLKGAVAKVRVGVDGGRKVLESVGVATGVRGRLGHVVQDLVVAESIDGVGRADRSEAIGLNSARILRVGEATVGANLEGSRAGRISGEGEGVGPADWSARRRYLVACRRSGSGGDQSSRGRGLVTIGGCGRRCRRLRLVAAS